MTLRQKIADWISGGELTRLRNRNCDLVNELDCAVDLENEAICASIEMRKQLGEVSRELADTKRDLERTLKLYAKSKSGAITIKRSAALSQIIAQETPYANATVRRMAAIAREALE